MTSPPIPNVEIDDASLPLTVKQTATGYWIVQDGVVDLAGAPTRNAAESERDVLRRLRDRTQRRRLIPAKTKV